MQVKRRVQVGMPFFPTFLAVYLMVGSSLEKKYVSVHNEKTEIWQEKLRKNDTSTPTPSQCLTGSCFAGLLFADVSKQVNPLFQEGTPDSTQH